MKPMLSATLKDPSSLTFPVLCSPKLDGIRCLMIHGQPVTRNLKPIPNNHIRETLRGLGLPGLDGELIVGKSTAADCYRATNSGVMSHDGEPDWHFKVFDAWDVDGYPFQERFSMASSSVKLANNKRIRMVPHKRIHAEHELDAFEAEMLAKGYEGVMGRSLHGLYKFGRATMREGSLWKLKRFVDGEAVVQGFDEQLHNANEKTVDNLGRAKRSSHKENKHGKGTLGALKVQELASGVHFDIGTGFTDAERQAIWDSRDSWLGRVVKYKSLPIGVKDKPRHPVYLGERKDI